MHLNPGQELYIGRPKQPLSQNVTESLRTIVGRLLEINEAHLPQVYIPGTTEGARQVLFVVTDSDFQLTVQKVGAQVSELFSSDFSIDIWPLRRDDPLLTTIREADMRIK